MEESKKKIINNETDKILSKGEILSTDNQNKLNDIINSIIDITKLSELSQKEVDIQFEIAKKLLMDYGKVLGSFTYNLDIRQEEFNFIKKQVMDKLVYGRQDVFVGKKVKESFIKPSHPVLMLDDVYKYQLKIEEVTWLSYLTGKFEITGLNQANTFSTIVEKLGEVSRVFEVFQNKGTEISETFHNWLNGFQEELLDFDQDADSQPNSEQKTLISKKARVKE